MATTFFLKQHTIWLPKWWLLVIIALTGLFLLWFGVKNMANYLAVSEPKYGTYLVVEGWLNRESLGQALLTFRDANNRYEYLITTGGPDTRGLASEGSSYAEQSAQYFLSKGVDKKKVIIISTPASAQARTFLSAVKVRDWLMEAGKENVVMDVFTGGVHARRTLFLYNLAFHSEIDIGVYAADPSSFELETWWKTSDGAKSTTVELFGLLWVVCFFEPGEHSSHQEKWGKKYRPSHSN